MALLSWARLLVAWVPLRDWRASLGLADGRGATLEEARQLAADVEWAAKRLPFQTKCLPRAMALSWLLRRRKLGHSLVIAARPKQQRTSADALHAWVEVGGYKIVGDLPGPWAEIVRLDG